MKPAVPRAYRTLREKFPLTTVEISYWGVEIAPLGEVTGAQIGYGMVPDGVEGGTSNWEKSWLVIGRETLCGDPVFIDTSRPELPVFTAAHGMGIWEPILIAPSIKAFFEILLRLAALAKGRENPVALEENPIPKQAVQQFRKLLSAYLGRQFPSFWRSVFED
jgi:hypothetical protein